MNNKQLLISALLASSVSVSAFADPTCTTAPKEQLMNFDQARQMVVDKGYSIKKFKTTKTGCYELYGKTADNKRVEIYYNPTDMSVVKEEIDD